jgi:hypothetical protein
VAGHRYTLFRLKITSLMRVLRAISAICHPPERKVAVANFERKVAVLKSCHVDSLA